MQSKVINHSRPLPFHYKNEFEIVPVAFPKIGHENVCSDQLLMRVSERNIHDSKDEFELGIFP